MMRRNSVIMINELRCGALYVINRKPGDCSYVFMSDALGQI